MSNISIYNMDCVTGAQEYLADGSVDLMVCDPPFGIGEGGFDRHYARKGSEVLEGYVEAPTTREEYLQWTKDWISEAWRVMSANGSLYVIVGHTNQGVVEQALLEQGFELINHIIWKYNFGVATKTKFVTSHYHIFYVAKPGAKRTFNSAARYGSQEKDDNGRSLQYADMEDVWFIKKEYSPGETKNVNKLPDALLEKILLYSSNPGDLVCDFFMGNFTTARVALSLGRRVAGFEVNTNSYEHHLPHLEAIGFGSRLNELPEVIDERPRNQGKPLSDSEIEKIVSEVKDLRSSGMTKKDAIQKVGEKFGRGRFSITNILKKHEGKS